MPISRSFGELQEFACVAGYTLNGDPAGEIEFVEDWYCFGIVCLKLRMLLNVAVASDNCPQARIS